MNPSSRSRSRRFFLRAGLTVGGTVAWLGGAVFVHRGIAEGHLSPSGSEVIRAISQAVLIDLLPTDEAARAAALDAHVKVMDGFFGNLPSALRLETSVLLGALGNIAGRVAMTGMTTAWAQANVDQIQAALEKLRLSPLSTVQSAYHALRDLIVANYFTTPSGWAAVGYPGPLDV